LAYSYDQVFAADPANPANIAQNAAITIYAPGDVTMTPLTLTDPSGGALTNPIQVNANGFGSAFQHATLDRVAWSGGGFTGFFTSYEGMKDEAVAAREAAEAAAASAGAEAAAVADAAIGDATAEATAAKSAAETAASNASASATAAANAAALVGAPADTAIAAAVNGNGATKTALNATILDQVSTSGKAPKAAIDAAIATAVQVPKSPRMVALGHSLIAAGDGLGLNYGDSIQHMLSAYSGGKLELIKNAGVAGQSSTLILARFDTDVTPHNPGVVFIMARTNDYSGGSGAPVSFATSKANHEALIAKCAAIGAVPIMATTPPVSNASAAEKLENAKFDNWLRGYCKVRNIVCVDLWTALVSTTANAWPSNDWTNDGATGLPDGTHPLPIGYKKIAETIVSALPAWPAVKRTAVTQADPNNYLLNALMLNDTNADGLADSWVEFNSPTATSRAYSLVTDPNVPGKMQRITINETGSNFAQLRQEVNTTAPDFYTAGDVLGVYAVVTLEDTALTVGKNLRLQLKVVEGGAPAFADHLASLTVGIFPGRASGVVKHERVVLGQRFVARDGIFVTSVQFVLTPGTYAGASGGAGYAQFGAVRLVNLTRMGLA
jgi:lysophospholipase L1-like esterase